MKKPSELQSRRFVALPSFVLRSATLPFEALESLLSSTTAPAPERRAHSAERLRQWAASPLGRESLKIASQGLFEATQGATRRGGPERLERSLYSYFARMSARPTPFGLFASLATGTVSEDTNLELADLPLARKRIQVDGGRLSALVAQLNASPEVRAEQRYRTSSSLWTQGQVVRVLSFSSSENDYAETPLKPLLTEILREARSGLTVPELDQLIARRQPRASEAQRQKYLANLIETGLLQSSLVLSSTGLPLLQQIIRQTSEIPALQATSEALRQLDTILSAQFAPGEHLDVYDQVESRLQAAPLSLPPDHALHVDLWRPLAHAHVGPEILEQMISTARFLAGLGRRPDTPLRRFTDRFLQRYDNREIPLLEAIDEVYGMGLGEASVAPSVPLLEGMALPPPPSPEWTRFESLQQRLLERLLEASARQEQEVVLRDEEFGERKEELPSWFSVLVTLAGPLPGDETGTFSLVQPSFMYEDGIGLLGRFCALDSSIEELARSMIAVDQGADPDLYVDVNVLPDNRNNNVVVRPSLREAEVLVQGGSGAAPERQIPLEDLVVRVKDGKLEVCSKRLGRRLKVRPTNALNMRHGSLPSLLQFFAMISPQTPTLRGHLDWGTTLSRLGFLPRLRHGRSILSPARWLLREDDLKPLRAKDRDQQARVIATLREAKRWPRWISIGEGDQRIAIDLENPIAVDLLVHEIQEKTSFPVEEFLPGLLPRLVRGPGGTHVSEIFVAFGSHATLPPAQPASVRLATKDEGDAPALCLPGSEWLYFKLYGPAVLQDDILRHTLGPWLRSKQEGGQLRGWFFLRYQDDLGPHLRLRLRPTEPASWPTLAQELAALGTDLRVKERLTHLQIDSYSREVIRYGGLTGVRLAEGLFEADSRCALALLELEPPPVRRWQIVGRSVDALLADFGLSAEQKRDICQHAAAGFQQEVYGKLDPPELAAQCRRHRSLMAQALLQGDEWQDEQAVLSRRSQEQRDVVASLREAERAGALSESIDKMLGSYIHLLCNRLLTGPARPQEMVLYTLLQRHYHTVVLTSPDRSSPSPTPAQRTPPG